MKTDSSRSIPRFPSLAMERIDRTILLIRGQKAILDADLAARYGVPTKAFNQAVKRNLDRFPSDFMFRLTPDEKTELVTKCDHLRRLKFSTVFPSGFTEHGAIMAASVLNSPRAIAVSGYVVRAFVHLREAIASHHEFAGKLAEIERKLIEHDERFAQVCEAIREMMQPAPVPPKGRTGFSMSEE